MKKSILILAVLVMTQLAVNSQSLASDTAAPSPVIADTLLAPLSAELRRDYVVTAGDTLRSIALREYGDYRYWPIIFLTNKDLLPNPERLDTNATIRIYQLPFSASAPDAAAKPLLAEVYLQTYEKYLTMGPQWTNERRWVLLEALYFNADLFAQFPARINEEDTLWYSSRFPK